MVVSSIITVTVSGWFASVTPGMVVMFTVALGCLAVCDIAVVVVAVVLFRSVPRRGRCHEGLQVHGFGERHVPGDLAQETARVDALWGVGVGWVGER